MPLSRSKVKGAVRFPVAAATLADLRDQRGGTSEVAHPRARHAPTAERWSGSCESAPASRTSWICPGRDRRASLRCPTRGSWRKGASSPTAGRPQRGCSDERVRCLLQRRSPGGVSVDGQQSKAVEQQVEGTRTGLRGAGRARTARPISNRTSASRGISRHAPRRPRRSRRFRGRVGGRTAPSRLAASSRSRGASPKRPEAKATWPRSSVARAAWNPSSG